jgi:hypothetical protein
MKPVIILSAIAFINLWSLSAAAAAKAGDAPFPRTSPAGVAPADRELACFWFVAMVAIFPSIILGAAYLLLTWLFPSMGGA